MEKTCGNCKHCHTANDIALINGNDVHLTSYCSAIGNGGRFRPKGIQPEWKCSNNRFAEKG